MVDKEKNIIYNNWLKWIDGLMINNKFAEVVLKIRDWIQDLTNTDYDFIFHIILSKVQNNIEISEDILPVFSDEKFLKILNEFLKEKLSKVLNEPCVFTFDELSQYISLLWLWKYFDIIINLSTCNVDSLDKLCFEYEKRIYENIWNEEKSEIYFDAFINLIRSINSMCVLDQVNTYRKKMIPDLIEILKKHMEFLIFKLNSSQDLSEKRENDLDYFLWLFWINFTHNVYIEPKDNLESLSQNFLHVSTDQWESYKLTKKSNFWNNPDKKVVIDSVYLWNFSSSLSLLIYKTQKINYEKLWKLPSFKSILRIFWEFYWDENKFLNYTVEEIKIFCNNIYSSIYLENNNYEVSKTYDYTIDIINDFINPWNIHSEWSIESIHNLILFNKLPRDLLLNIWNYLITNNAYNNYSFEFFKLKILDIIIERLNTWVIPDEINNFLRDVILYVEKNKQASQLLDAYSNLYLSIAFFYSCNKNSSYQFFAKEYFTKFLRINNNAYWNLIYKYDLELFYFNIWYAALENTVWHEENELNSNYSDEAVACIWKTIIRSFQENKEKILEMETDTKIRNLLSKAINWDSLLVDNDINSEISESISNNIFNWITKVTVTKKDAWKKIVKIWLSVKTLDLWKNYELNFIYPTQYQSIFENIYNANEYFLKNRLTDIISASIKQTEVLFEDDLTWLQNESKLRYILSENKENLNFITIRLSTLQDINSIYSRDIWDQFLSKIWYSLAEKSVSYWFKVFKLNWAKFWLLVEDRNNIENIISFLSNLHVTLDIHKEKLVHEKFKLDAFYWIVIQESDKVLEKASQAIFQAKETWNNLYYFSETENFEDENKKSLNQLMKLDKAIEENRIVPFFQPLKNLSTWEIKKYECLMRVQNWEKFESPFQYLEVAKKYWRLPEIAKIMIKKVFEFASNNPNYSFSFNLSWEDLSNSDIISLIEEELKKYEIINIWNLTAEVLEWEWKDYEKIKTSILQLKKLWLKIAIDDYWAEHSNINRINELLDAEIPDYIKIDWSLIRRLTDLNQKKSSSAKADIENIIKKAWLYWVETVWEFIENLELELLCKHMWITYWQWYNIWKPNSSLEILE